MATSNQPLCTVKRSVPGWIEFYHKTPKAQNFQLHLAVDMYGSAIGPMPVDVFMNEFMQTDHSFDMDVPEDFFASAGILKGPGEAEMYNPLVDILNNGKINGRNLCPNLCFVKTASDRNNKPDFTDITPDVVVYEGSQPPPKLDWTLPDFFLELKFSKVQDGYHDFFQNSRQYVEHDTNNARRTRGQIYAYAARQMSDQHRLFVFCVGIYGQFVRFFRIDRSSVVVSARANYITNPKVLVEFLLRYGRLTRTQRGYDPTVSLATEIEKKLFISHVTQYLERVRGNENLREHAGAQKLLESKYPIHKVQVNDAKTDTTHFYLIREPTARYPVMSPCTRATRGYIAVYMPIEGDDLINQEAGHLNWLKDFWRTDGFETEAAILHQLREAGVSHLPIVRCAGDVLFDGETQRTVNDTWRTKEEANTWRRPVGGNIRALIHHRVVEELLHPLSSVTNARELLRSGRDISEAIIDAYFKAERLHQDVSFGNVMVKEDVSNGQRETAILIDWDYSRPLDAIDSAGFYNRRTGTWPFMSIALLKNTNKRHHVLDDMESLYWVLLFAAIHHFKHSGDFRPSLFDHYELHTSPGVTGERPFGGSRKIEWLCAPDVEFQCRSLVTFFSDLGDFYQDLMLVYLASMKSARHKEKYLKRRSDIMSNLRDHPNRFYNLIEDPESDWNDGSAVPDQYLPQNENQNLLTLSVSMQEASETGPWPGSGAPDSSSSGGSRKRSYSDSAEDDETTSNHNPLPTIPEENAESEDIVHEGGIVRTIQHIAKKARRWFASS